MHGRIACVPAYVEREAASGVSIDGGVVNHHISVVVGQRVRRSIVRVVQRQRHAVQRQIAVVLDQDLRLRRGDSTILEGDLVVLQQLEAVGLGAGAADCLAVHRVGVAVKVDRQAVGELALRHHDTVARSILQQSNGFAVLGFDNRCLEGGVTDFTDLGNRFADDPDITVLDGTLAANDIFRIRFSRILAAGDEAGLITPSTDPFIECAVGDA